MSPRIGDWMQTAGGRQFWPLDPRPEEVHLDDVAHALSHMCRFGGHCRTFYSVAEHSVRVSRPGARRSRRRAPRQRWLRRRALAGLMHDAAEAYIGDMIRPLKTQPGMAAFCLAEREIEIVIAARFGFPFGKGRHVRDADERLLATEARDIMGGQSAGKWSLRAEPLADTIEPWAPEIARGAFLGRFAALGGIS